MEGEEELASNEEHQSMELQSLECIYGDAITVIQKDVAIEFLVEVVPAVDEKLELFLPKQQQQQQYTSAMPYDGSAAAPMSSPRPRVTEVTHLPPLTLYVKYHKYYPSRRCPDFHVSARWMDKKATDAVGSKLREAFVPGEGSVVVFDWLAFLHDDVIRECCCFPPEGCLGSIGGNSGSQEAGAEEKLSSRHPCQVLLRSGSQMDDMEAYDQLQCLREFQLGRHSCVVCLDELPGTDFVPPCDMCSGLICKDCLLHYCEVSISEGKGARIKCLGTTSCSHILPDSLLRDVLPPSLFDRYTHLCSEAQLDSIPGMVYCPRPGCGARVVSEPDTSLAVCPQCGFPFCKLCQLTYHGPGPCPAFLKVKEETGESEEVPVVKKDKSDQHRVEELQNLVWLRTHASVKPCPKCSHMIQKSGGCNKMTCGHCSTSFCWLCLNVIAGYDHFYVGGCTLLRDQDYYPPQEEEELEAPSNQETLQDLLVSKCPRCQKEINKTSGNNWAKCEKCKFQYCHLCREPCFGLWHFSDYGCKKVTTFQEELEWRKANS